VTEATVLSDRPNEQANDGRELGDAAQNASLANGGDTAPMKPRAQIRWVQLAYDLEQYGDPDPDERGEVY
jgi:hypothetical protein